MNPTPSSKVQPEIQSTLPRTHVWFGSRALTRINARSLPGPINYLVSFSVSLFISILFPPLDFLHQYSTQPIVSSPSRPEIIFHRMGAWSAFGFNTHREAKAPISFIFLSAVFWLNVMLLLLAIIDLVVRASFLKPSHLFQFFLFTTQTQNQSQFRSRVPSFAQFQPEPLFKLIPN